MRDLRILAQRRGLAAFRRDERGGAAVIFALVAIFLLIPAALIGLDLYVASSQKSRVQDSLDSATLFAARSTATTDAQLKAEGEKALLGNLEIIGGDPAALISYEFKGGNGGRTVIGQATVRPATFINWCRETRGDKFCWMGGPVTATAVVDRGGQNLEVALALDITGSMSGQKIADLKAAAGELIDIVVQSQQAPFYSKVAIAPYSMAVNVGPWADQVRGPITAPVAVTAASKANPVAVTAPSHGFSLNDNVYIDSVVGMTELNKNWYKASNVSANAFDLSGVNGTSFKKYKSGGQAYCTVEGCQYFLFKSDFKGTDRLFPVTTCATERSGAEAFTDAAPTAALLGRNYAGSSNPCPAQVIMPLSSDKAALKAKISSLTASGSTAGHLGVAWGWYLVSPNFAYLFTGDQKPAAYGAPDTVKAVVLMTDGAFNTTYCKGVISKDAGTGSGSTQDHISCNAPNGDAFSQAKKLCDAMKAKNVVVYTVGFDVGSDAAAKQIMSECASSPAHVYNPETGVELKAAFKDIAQELSR
ncbi:MAG: ubiquitin-activating E1 FCCH domain-containing protein, partial [Phenylobacterium sp.]